MLIEKSLKALQHEELVVTLAKELVSRPSITPDDNECQNIIADRLAALGFECVHLESHGVKNLIACYDSGMHGPSMGFMGHTDVVPSGDIEKWTVPPFSATVIDDVMYGRGVVDMKGGIAAMLAAVERYILQGNEIKGKFTFLITSDEEGEAEYGSKSIVQYLSDNNYDLDFCIVGEPTSNLHSGDVIKVGRRGSISGFINVFGKAGHVAYPQYAKNAIHIASRICSYLLSLEWAKGCNDFPGTNLEISGIESNTFTDNVIPDFCKISFNIRFDHNHTIEGLSELVEKGVSEVSEAALLTWERPCQPYYTEKPADDDASLEAHIAKAIFAVTSSFPVLSMSGGTSDGRFFSDKKTQVIEVGLPNKTIHQIDERIHVKELIVLENIYHQLLCEVFNR